MKIYVANCTNQRQEFIYRLPGIPAPRHQPIEIGRQVQLSGDLGKPELDAILAQHEKYGLVRVQDIDRTRPFSGLCWDEKPISTDKVKRMLNHNHDVLSEEGRKNRQAAAVAANNAVEEQTPGALKSLELSAEELPTDKNPDPEFADGVRVTSDASETGGRASKPGKGKSRSTNT